MPCSKALRLSPSPVDTKMEVTPNFDTCRHEISSEYEWKVNCKSVYQGAQRASKQQMQEFHLADISILIIKEEHLIVSNPKSRLQLQQILASFTTQVCLYCPPNGVSTSETLTDLWKMSMILANIGDNQNWLKVSFP